MGDALTVVEQLADEIVVPFKVPKKLHKSASLTSKSDVLKLGVACYAKAARLQPENAGVWHNLACNYHAQAENTPDGVAAEDLRHKALSAMKRALSLEPKSHLHWNAMGVLAFRTGEAYFGLAQHAFIKSVEQENNSEAWTNLGILYLVMGYDCMNAGSFFLVESH
jgi:tetratricopeptide (TPR) repeat protein